MPKPPPMPPTTIGPGPFRLSDLLIGLFIVVGGTALAVALMWCAR